MPSCRTGSRPWAWRPAPTRAPSGRRATTASRRATTRGATATQQRGQPGDLRDANPSVANQETCAPRAGDERLAAVADPPSPFHLPARHRRAPALRRAAGLLRAVHGGAGARGRAAEGAAGGQREAAAPGPHRRHPRLPQPDRLPPTSSSASWPRCTSAASRTYVDGVLGQLLDGLNVSPLAATTALLARCGRCPASPPAAARARWRWRRRA